MGLGITENTGNSGRGGHWLVVGLRLNDIVGESDTKGCDSYLGQLVGLWKRKLRLKESLLQNRTGTAFWGNRPSDSMAPGCVAVAFQIQSNSKEFPARPQTQHSAPGATMSLQGSVNTWNLPAHMPTVCSEMAKFSSCLNWGLGYYTLMTMSGTNV